VPALVTEKGEKLPDSVLIVEYLLTRGRGLAAHAARRGALGAAAAPAAGGGDHRRSRLQPHGESAPPEFIFQGWLDRKASAINGALDALDAEAAELLHDGPSAPWKSAAGAALWLSRFPPPAAAVAQRRSGWRAGYFSFAQRPSMLSTQPPAGA